MVLSATIGTTAGVLHDRLHAKLCTAAELQYHLHSLHAKRRYFLRGPIATLALNQGRLFAVVSHHRYGW